MGDREEFLDWFRTTWREAEVALHDGDAGPRDRTWSAVPPVTLFGAWYTATDPAAVRAAFDRLASSFARTTASEVDVLAAEVSGDLAYTVCREAATTTVDGAPRDYVLRVTQVYRREAEGWKVVHRHGERVARIPRHHLTPVS